MDGIKAAILDVDGCFISPQGQVSPVYYRGLSKIARFVQQGNEGKLPSISLCSGRPGGYLEAVSYMIGLSETWAIAESGICLLDIKGKRRVWNPALTLEVREQFPRVMQEVIPPILQKYPDIFLYPWNEFNIALELVPDSTSSLEECYEMILSADGVKELVREKKIVGHYSDSAVDITPCDVNGKPIEKASGVKFWADYTQTNLQKVLYIGDSNGDLAAMQTVGYVGCPKNASPDCKKLVKQRGGYVSNFSLANGVADILCHFLTPTSRIFQ